MKGQREFKFCARKVYVNLRQSSEAELSCTKFCRQKQYSNFGASSWSSDFAIRSQTRGGSRNWILEGPWRIY